MRAVSCQRHCALSLSLLLHTHTSDFYTEASQPVLSTDSTTQKAGERPPRRQLLSWWAPEEFTG